MGCGIRMDSKAAEPIVRELYNLWLRSRDSRFRLGGRRFLRHLYLKFGKRVFRWQVCRLRRQFEAGKVWVDEEGNVHRRPRGIVAKQESFKSAFYGLGLEPDRGVFREAMKMIQSGRSPEEVLDAVLSGDVGRMVAEKILRKLKGEGAEPAAEKLHLQNMLAGPASMWARYLLCMKYKSTRHMPLKEHRKLTGKIIRAWYKLLKDRVEP